MRTATLILACLALAVACGEDPQRLDAAKAPGYRTDGWNSQLRERTLHQGEAERIYP
jgi:hypothetical protein